MPTPTPVLSTAAAAAALLLVPAGGALAHPGHGDGLTHPQRNLVRQLDRALKDFRDVDEAVAAGYASTVDCVEVPGLGAMGVHFVRPTAIDAEIDRLKPEVLVYMPDEDGDFELVAAEYISTAPSAQIAGVEFEPGPFPGQVSRHVWVWEENPAGTFAAFNPAIACP